MAPRKKNTEGAKTASPAADAPEAVKPDAAPHSADANTRADKPEGLGAQAPSGETSLPPQEQGGAGEADGGVTSPVSDAGLAVLVTGPKKGRWRAGRYFGPEPVRLVVADLTPAEIAAIAEDPKLTVEPAPTPDPV